MYFCIDDVVVSYVCGVVEEVATGDEEEIDSVEMKDVMSAYIPAFEEISENEVKTWVKLMVKKVLEEKNKEKTDMDAKMDSLVSCFTAPARKHRNSSTNSETSERSQKLSETSDSSEENIKIKEDSNYAESLAMLLELFPNTCTLEAQHCLSSSGGNIEEATSLLLERQDQGISIKTPNTQKNLQKGSKVVDDKTLRNSIINRYGFVDHEDDHKEHRPVAPKWEGKKMIRYRDNKVVSLKGERYTEIKKEESEDLKKTYVNLKPAKQYRFH
ncbi:CUE domain-containing protein 2-A [Armadillidium vulgare]|nr:CUE domain-containing protein 2-A [Armadillidium vulgare]